MYKDKKESSFPSAFIGTKSAEADLLITSL